MGASQGGVLIRDDGFEGFSSLHEKPGHENAATQRDLTDFEKQALDEMKKNDEEIDELIGLAIEKLDRLDLHA